MLKARHKFNAKRTTLDNLKFDSKLEAKYYWNLKTLKLSGEVIGWLRQTPLHFKSGITYRLDFLVFYADGRCEAVDVKGVETKEFKLKKQLIEDEYPWLDLKIVTKV